MDRRLTKFVEQTELAHAGRMKTQKDLFNRRPCAKDWVDAAVIGGATLEDIINGQVTDADLDPKVVEAFHTQYPHAGSFVEKVEELSDDPDALRGLVSGVKGKLFEQEYVEFLNDGHLPAGFTAELAESPVQQGWDVAIKGPEGGLVEQLQLKASNDVTYIREAIEKYPDFEVIVPTDVFEELSTDADLAGHIIDSGIHTDNIVQPIGDAIEAAGSASLDLVPEFAFLFIGASAIYSLARGKRSRADVVKSSGKRMAKAGVAGAAGGLAAWAMGPWVGVPVSIGARLLMSRREANAEYDDRATQRIERLRSMTGELDLPGRQGVTPPSRTA